MSCHISKNTITKIRLKLKTFHAKNEISQVRAQIKFFLFKKGTITEHRELKEMTVFWQVGPLESTILADNGLISLVSTFRAPFLLSFSPSLNC